MTAETKAVNVLLPVDTIIKMKSYADKHGRKLASVHNSAILAYINSPKKPKKRVEAGR